MIQYEVCISIVDTLYMGLKVVATDGKKDSPFQLQFVVIGTYQ